MIANAHQYNVSVLWRMVLREELARLTLSVSTDSPEDSTVARRRALAQASLVGMLKDVNEELRVWRASVAAQAAGGDHPSSSVTVTGEGGDR